MCVDQWWEQLAYFLFFFSLYWHSVIHFPTIRQRVDCVIQFSLVCRFSVFFSLTLLYQLIYFRHFSYLSNLISRNSWACRFWSIFSFVFTCVCAFSSIKNIRNKRSTWKRIVLNFSFPLFSIYITNLFPLYLNIDVKLSITQLSYCQFDV